MNYLLFCTKTSCCARVHVLTVTMDGHRSKNARFRIGVN